MLPRPVKTSVPFYSTLLDTLHASTAAVLRPLRQTHAVILTVGLSRSDFLRSKLAACYARFSAVNDALLVFDRSNRRPTFVYNSLLRSFASLRLHAQALSLFRLLLCYPSPAPDHRTFAAALGSCCGARFLPLGRALHASWLARGSGGKQSDDIVVDNSLISMYSRCGDVESAREVFERMPEKNVVSWTAMIGAYGLNGYAPKALRLFEEMLEVGVRPDGKAMMVVLGVCAYHGLAEMGWRVFGMMDGRFRVRPGVEHYAAMASMLGRAGLVEEVEELVGGMEAVPDAVMWRVLVGACKMHGRMDVVERIMERVQILQERREGESTEISMRNWSDFS